MDVRTSPGLVQLDQFTRHPAHKRRLQNRNIGKQLARKWSDHATLVTRSQEAEREAELADIYIHIAEIVTYT